MQFFEVKDKYSSVADDGAPCTKAEDYALQALSFTEAEARITAHMEPYITGDFEVCAIKKANYGAVVFNGGGRYYLVKYILISVDENGGKEKRHPMHVLFEEEDIDRAKEHARDYMRGSLLDYDIASIRETGIIEALLYDDGQTA